MKRVAVLVAVSLATAISGAISGAIGLGLGRYWRQRQTQSDELAGSGAQTSLHPEPLDNRSEAHPAGATEAQDLRNDAPMAMPHHELEPVSQPRAPDAASQKILADYAEAIGELAQLTSRRASRSRRRDNASSSRRPASEAGPALNLESERAAVPNVWPRRFTRSDMASRSAARAGDR